MNGIALISSDASQKVISGIKKFGLEPLAVPRTDLVDRRISSHPDIQLFPFRKKIFCHPDTDKKFLSRLDKYIETVLCGTHLSEKYPEDVPYNIAFTGTHALHLFSSADPTVRKHLEENKISLIKIKQGYAKCSVLTVNEKKIITSDTGIHNSAISGGLDSILIEKGFVLLSGHDYGFIGGASGSYENNILLTGHIDNHPDKTSILGSIESSGKKTVFLSNEPASDIGSIFII